MRMPNLTTSPDTAWMSTDRSQTGSLVGHTACKGIVFHPLSLLHHCHSCTIVLASFGFIGPFHCCSVPTPPVGSLDLTNFLEEDPQLVSALFRATQVFLDVGLPNTVYETIRTDIMKYLEDNPKSYSGNGQVINCSSGDPMKVQLGVFFEYAHCGEVPLNRLPTTTPSNPHHQPLQLLILADNVPELDLHECTTCPHVSPFRHKLVSRHRCAALAQRTWRACD